MIGTVTPLGDTHFHVCDRCAEIWCHTKTSVTPEERERIHRCPRCTAGPYITAYETRREADDVKRVIRAANDAAIASPSPMRAALQNLVDALAANDEDGLTEFAEPMIAARKALAAYHD